MASQGAGLKNDENAYCRAAKSSFGLPQTSQQGFAIHIDQELHSSKAKENQIFIAQESFLKPAVTGLSRPALTSVFTSKEASFEGRTCKFSKTPNC